ncbi:MAG TPA: glycosyltransferase family 4 protein [Solirubrobacterales bacterium]|jgi:glycosyltransferase involved in cell wall biosynthesis|nr:glycosyltransferase family 4 protein [Solirubrobacterales bacterium]
MRVLLASDYYPPFIGGAHRQAQLLAQGMTERGHEVAVVSQWHGGLPELEREGEVDVYRVRQLRTAIPALVRSNHQRHQPPFPDPVTVRGIRRAIKEFEPDLIHAYGWITFSVAAAIGRRRIPLLVSARDYGYFCATRTLLRKGVEPCSGPAPLKCTACAQDYYGAPKGWIATAGVYASRPIVARKITGLHSVSTYVQDVTSHYLFGGKGVPEDVLRVTIPSFQSISPADAVDRDDPEVAAVLERLPREPFILFVGAFRKIKGLETLFDAYAQLESPPPLVLMGTYERDSPQHFPAEAVIFTDVPHAAVMAAWDRALFGVMPSLLPEPFGATVAEAMNRGRPVVGTQLGGHVDIIGDSAGILVPQGDAPALAGAMKELIEDPERREEFARQAAIRADNFTAPSILPRFEQTYREVIAAGSRTGPALAG